MHHLRVTTEGRVRDVLDEPIEQVQRVYIDGLTLEHWVKPFEAARAHDTWHPNAPPRYVSLLASEVPQPAHWLLGVAYAARGGAHPRVRLLDCPCRAVGCHPLFARLEVLHHRVHWYGFHNPHLVLGRDGTFHRYAGLGPFVFEREQYERALGVPAGSPWSARRRGLHIGPVPVG